MKRIKIISLALFSSLLIGGVISSSYYSSNNQLLAEDESRNIFLGEKVTVSERRIIYGTDYQNVKGRIVTPSGNSFVGREFTANEHGLYQVIYEAYFGHHKETKVLNYLCQRKAIDYFNVNDSASIDYGDFRYNTNRYSHNGVIVNVKSGAEIKFNEPLDMNDFLVPQQIDDGKEYKDASSFKTANALIDMIVDPETQLSADFTGLLIKLTDVDDVNNEVEIRIEAPTSQETLAGALSYTRVGFTDGFMAGWEYAWGGHEGHYHFTSSGTGLALSFKGQPYEQQLHSGSILLDYSNKRFYTYPGSLSHSQTFFINDLDDISLYKNNIWSGFKNGKCYLSITPYNFKNTRGRLLIKSIGKFDFSNEVLVDTEAPKINIDYVSHSVSSIPNAVIGERYKIFDADIRDNYDSNLKADVNVYYTDTINNKDIDVSIKNGSFLANKIGQYKIVYNAKDRSGNVSNPVTVKVDTVDHVSDINLSLSELEKNVTIFDEVNLPSTSTVTATGGSGIINVSSKLYNPNNEEVEFINNKFTPNLLGDYHLKFEGVDYIGHIGELDYVIHVGELLAPKFIDNINLPPVMIKGFTYHFDNVKAVETTDGQVKYLEPVIKVNDLPYENAVVASGSNMKVEYVAGDTTQAFNIPVVDIEDPVNIIDQSKYFYGDMDVVMDEEDVMLSATHDSSVIFANKVDTAGFYVLFEKVDGMTNFTNIHIKLTDIKNTLSTATIDIDVVNNKISIPGFEDLSFAVSKNELSVSYNDKNGKVLDTAKNEIGNLVYNDEGALFSGFPYGAYLEISLLGVTAESSILVKKVNNQVLGYGEGSGDEIGPYIRTSSELLSVQQFGEKFQYPDFEAYDVLSEVETKSIKITKPSGNVFRVNMSTLDTFTIDEFGTYIVRYESFDSNGNIGYSNIPVVVFDKEAPTLDVNGGLKDKYHQNNTIDIMSYSVRDNLVNVSVDVMLIMPTNEIRILSHFNRSVAIDGKVTETTLNVLNRNETIKIFDSNGKLISEETKPSATLKDALYNSLFVASANSVRLEMKGKYTLRYVAYDSEFNKTVKEFVFNAY